MSAQVFGAPTPLRGEVEEALREGLALFEMFRRLKFSADDIYLMIDATNAVGMVLRAEGKQLSVTLLDAALREGVMDEQIVARWQFLAHRYNADPTFAMEVYTNAHAPKNGTKILTGLHNAGFKPRWAANVNEALRLWNKPTMFLQ